MKFLKKFVDPAWTCDARVEVENMLQEREERAGAATLEEPPVPHSLKEECIVFLIQAS